MSEKDPHRYDDIIDLPHFVSRNRRHMSNYDRAAQFAPFDALTGYSEAISETARLTQDEIILTESQKEILDRKFRILSAHINERPKVEIVYFMPDLYKEGGHYLNETITIRKIDLVQKILITSDQRKYELSSIIEVNGEIFDQYPEN